MNNRIRTFEVLRRKTKGIEKNLAAESEEQIRIGGKNKIGDKKKKHGENKKEEKETNGKKYMN